MLEDLLESLDAFEAALDIVTVLIEDNPDLSHKLTVQRRFFDIYLKFNYISEDIQLNYNYMDYIAAIEIVKKKGWASIAQISRELGIIYKQSYKLILRMEEEGIVERGTGTQRGIRFFKKDKE